MSRMLMKNVDTLEESITEKAHWYEAVVAEAETSSLVCTAIWFDSPIIYQNRLSNSMIKSQSYYLFRCCTFTNQIMLNTEKSQLSVW